MRAKCYGAAWRCAFAAVIFSVLCLPNVVPTAQGADFIAQESHTPTSQQNVTSASHDKADNIFALNGLNHEGVLGALVLVTVFSLIIIPIYFLPMFIALARNHEYKVVITIVNIFCGWTGFIWLGILAWSVWPRQSQEDVKADRLSYGHGFTPHRRPPPFPSSGQGTARSGLTEEQMSQLEKVGQLKQDGILSETEFQQAKERILQQK